MAGSNGTRRPRNRRDLILKAAARLFYEKGYENTTVRELAEAVDMQSGSLFFHFGSKEEILLAVLESASLHAEANLKGALADAQTPLEKLSAVFHAHLRTVLDDERRVYTIVLRDWRPLSPQSRKKVIALRDKYERVIAEVLDEVAQSGLIPHDIRLFRLFLLGALNWTVQWYRSGGEFTIDELAEKFLSIVLSNRRARRHAGTAPLKITNH